jgi:hypothetical protein
LVGAFFLAAFFFEAFLEAFFFTAFLAAFFATFFLAAFFVAPAFFLATDFSSDKTGTGLRREFWIEAESQFHVWYNPRQNPSSRFFLVFTSSGHEPHHHSHCDLCLGRHQ